MKRFTDQLNRSVEFPDFPRRIMSLVPSQTELLADLGMNEQITGITKFCVHPPGWLSEKNIIGGTKNLNLEKIKSLNPDLIIANKEENNKDQIEILADEFPVWISDVTDLSGAKEMITSVSELLNKSTEGVKINSLIESEFEKLSFNNESISCAYLIWTDPLMVAGGNTFISHMLNAAGFKNVFQNSNRYPESMAGEIMRLSPAVIFLSSEPYPFKEKHIDIFQSIFKSSKIMLADGEMFSWYGTRMLKAPEYFLSLRNKIVSEI